MTVKYSLNNGIKRPDFECEYTEEMLREIELCASDFFYFLKYVKILHPDKGRTDFIPRSYQERIFNALLNNKFVIACCSRQCGKTTSVAVYVVWYSCFNEDKYIAIGSNSAKSAQDFLQRVKIIYEELPIWLKPGVISYNELSIKFENGTSINTAATSKNAFRGRTVNLLILDEFAHLLSDKIADEFYTSTFPAISESSESKLIILSTPKGSTNLFARLYRDAENGLNDYVPIKVKWDEVPGRDEQWKEEQLKAMAFDYSKFKQEYEADFISSSRTLIEPNILKKIINRYKNHIWEEMGGRLRIWEHPVKGGRYVIGADPSKGVGKDYSAAQVLKINSLKPLSLEQVAVFNCNKTDAFELAEVVNRLGLYYNTALVMIENNAEGYATASQLHNTLYYPNLYCQKQKLKDLGIRATKINKARAVLFMKRVIEDESLIIYDKETIEQLSDFTEISINKFASVNTNDDLISALYWATYSVTLNILESSFELGNKKEEQIWGILSDVYDSQEDWSWLSTPSVLVD